MFGDLFTLVFIAGYIIRKLAFGISSNTSLPDEASGSQ